MLTTSILFKKRYYAHFFSTAKWLCSSIPDSILSQPICQNKPISAELIQYHGNLTQREMLECPTNDYESNSSVNWDSCSLYFAICFLKGAKVSSKTAKQRIMPQGQKSGSFGFVVNSPLLMIRLATKSDGLLLVPTLGTWHGIGSLRGSWIGKIALRPKLNVKTSVWAFQVPIAISDGTRFISSRNEFLAFFQDPVG